MFLCSVDSATIQRPSEIIGVELFYLSQHHCYWGGYTRGTRKEVHNVLETRIFICR